MVSTVASGNTAPYVGCSDITLMYSVVDVAGLNSVSRRILANAAARHGGHGQAAAPMVESGTARARADHVRRDHALRHGGRGKPSRTAATTAWSSTPPGTGGQAMEKLVEAGLIGGVLDITTTEVADLLVGGVFPCGTDRFEAILEAEDPLRAQPRCPRHGQLRGDGDGPGAVPGPRLHVHNAQVTLMRTTPEENREFARWIADKLNRSTAPLIVLIPEKGVSALDAPGQPFHDPEADAALFEELESRLEVTERRQVRRLPYHINDPEFAQALVEAFLSLAVPFVRGARSGWHAGRTSDPASPLEKVPRWRSRGRRS